LAIFFENDDPTQGGATVDPARTAASQRAFNALRLIVTIGWAIYPIGYVVGYTGGGSAEGLNIIYNLADFINKIAFGVVIWAAATSDSK